MSAIDHSSQLSDEEREAMEGLDDEVSDDLGTDEEEVEPVVVPPAKVVAPAAVVVPPVEAAAVPDAVIPAAVIESEVVVDDHVVASKPSIQLSDQFDADLAEKGAALKAKFDESDVSLTEFLDQRDAITREQANRDFNRNSVRTDMVTVENTFFKENATFRPDKNPVKFDTLNRQVMALQNDPDWKAKPYADVLNEAKRKVDEAFGIAPAPVQQKTPAIPPRPAASRDGLPPNIGDLPQAATNDVANSEDDALDSLDPIALESALVRMSPEKREAYLAR